MSPAGRRRPAPHALALATALLTAAAATAFTPGRLAVVDAFADPFSRGHFGAVFEAPVSADPGVAASAVASSAQGYQLSDLTFRPDGSLVVVDRDADPASLGPDPNGDAGHGAVFVVDAATQGFVLLADGRNYPAGLPPPRRTAFVDPRGIAALPDGRILVADADADPSDLGDDSSGFAGHGALYVVDAGGAVRLASNGTLSDDGPAPGGAPSWFEDPGAVAVTADGTVYVLDIFGDPLATGGRGAVFRVDLATGRLRLVAVSSDFRAPTGIAELRPGLLVVSDQIASFRGDGSRGTLFAVDLAAADPRAAVSVLATDARFRGPAGLGVAPDGSVFVADPFADPLRLGRIGGLFRLRPGATDPQLASVAADYRAAVSVRPVPPTDPAPTLDAVSPGSGEAGDVLTLTLAGSGFTAPGEVRIEPGIVVSAVRVIDAATAEADIAIDPAAVPGLRDVQFVGPDFQPATLPAGFDVLPRARPEVLSCAPAVAVSGTTVPISISGDRFDAAATLDLGAGVTLANVVRVDSTRMTADATVDAAALAGPRDVTVENPGMLRGTLPGGFTVIDPAPPTLDAIIPQDVRAGGSVDVTLTGSAFVPGMTLDLGAGITVGPLLIASPSTATGRLHVPAAAAPGPRAGTVTNPDLRSGTLADALMVEDRPAVRLVALVVSDVQTGNGSSRADPGETVDLDVLAWNASARGIANPIVRVTSPPGSGVLVTREAVTFAAGPGLLRRAGPPLPQLFVEERVPCGARLPLDVEILEGGTVLQRERVLLPVGGLASHGRKPWSAGDTVGGRRGDAVALADLDGDGHADLIVGAPREAPGGTFAAGRVVAISGATDDPLWTLDGVEAQGRRGAAIAGVGDVTGDGAEDLLVGAPGESAGAGRVLLVSGATGLVVRLIAGQPGEALGSSVALAGSSGLGGPQAIAGAPGAASGAGAAVRLALPGLAVLDRLDGTPGAELGAAVAAAGDLDDDGLPDVAVSAPGADRVFVWAGSGPTATLDGLRAGERFGASLSALGDADLDGVPDLAVGAPLADAPPLNGAGRVDLVSGRTGERRSVLGGSPGNEAGAAVAHAGDLDGDGVGDLAVGSPGALSGDGLVEIRSGASLALLSSHPGRPGSRGRMGARLAGPRFMGGDGLPDLAVGAPLDSPAGPLQAGVGFALKTSATCPSAAGCIPDRLEPNAAGSPTAVSWGEILGLTICRDDVDAFRIDLPAGRRAVIRVRFAHATGDLDATLHDGVTGAVVDQSLSVDDDEELGPAGPGGSWEARVYGFMGATNTYDLVVLDPDSCPPVAEIAGVRVRRLGSRQAVISWLPSADACHAPAPAAGYRVWEAPLASPAGPPGPFPAGSAFADVSALDLDGSAANEAFVREAPGLRYWLVTDIGRAGEDGPSGWPAGP